MSDIRNRLVDACTCCPCGMFTVQPRQPSAADKYRVTSKDEDETQRSNQFTLLHSSQLDNPELLFQKRFFTIADSDGEVDAYQLRQVLDGCYYEDFQYSGFSLDACRSMIALGDPDLSGQLRFQEARCLYDELRKWTTVFKKFDVDGNGYFLEQEFGSLLEDIGYKFNDRSVHAMATRYSDGSGRIHFYDFTSCLLKLTAMYESFRHKSDQNMRTASFSRDEFLQLTVYS